MYENYRKNFNRAENRDYDDDRYGDDRSRGDGRSTRDRYRRNPYASNRSEWDDRGREQGYGAMQREDTYGWYGGSHADRGSDRDYSRERPRQWAHDAHHDHYGEGASSFGYGAGQPYRRGEGDSRYFTGQQGSWAMPQSYGAGGSRSYGADYRDHDYARGNDDRGFWDRATDEVASWFGDEDAAQRREQDHRGRGPKDYIRSDERIREDANDRLTDDRRVDASSVTLSVERGEITLNGTVPTREEKRRAEDVVERISGVKHVQNNLRVAAATTGTGGDYTTNWSVDTVPAEGGTVQQAATPTSARTPSKV